MENPLLARVRFDARCARRRLPPSAFVDGSRTGQPGAGLSALYRPYAPTPPTLREMVVEPAAASNTPLRLCAAVSLPQLAGDASAFALAPSPGTVALADSRRAQTVALRDKFGLFLSVCSLLVSVQYLIPRTL